MMSNSENTLKIVRFGAFSFDPERGELRKARRLIHLRPLAVRKLKMLLDNAGSTVNREKLREQLWGGKVVEWEMGLHRVVDIVEWAHTQSFDWPTVCAALELNGVRTAAWATCRP